MPSGQPTVLVVDHDQDSLKVIGDILTAEGYRIHPADNVSHALTALEGATPDFIILDAHLPGMDPSQFERLATPDGKCHRIPLLLLTDSSDADEQLKALTSGAVDFVNKPVRAAELLTRVATQIELGRLRTQLENGVAQPTAELTAIVHQSPRSIPKASSAKRGPSNLLAAGIGHDVNNLLSGILANLDLLLEDFAVPSATRSQLQKIHSSINWALNIIRELMICPGEQATSFETVDIVPLAEEMMELLRIAVSKRARLNARFARNLPELRANPVQIRQIIMNLIINASEALRGDEGEIFLSLTAARPPSSIIGTPESWVRLTVCDTGHGMADEVREKIFDPFFTTKTHGRGLGLSMVHGIVLAHGGSITVTSAPGNGCAFEVLLPGIPQRSVHQRDLIPAERCCTSGTVSARRADS